MLNAGAHQLRTNLFEFTLEVNGRDAGGARY